MESQIDDSVGEWLGGPYCRRIYEGQVLLVIPFGLKVDEFGKMLIVVVNMVKNEIMIALYAFVRVDPS